ncbi:DUF6525 family protein [Cognatishimia sp. 1_MG-2023]|uniref:DUF6525 family protein n=1 Tax=Cognatishimia sp. 1_MG-2023 TaxID=3062642 RepID=UPI0026E17BA6|nr:DUF6525 family protein [Cognatishimia sp. 1_MG-2023]MDO6726964.1 DUF6525 family protein [Cognatishimia sp. 1_MG-2023]
MAKNLNTSLRRKRRAKNPMSEFDNLPVELRSWIATAQLPWSPHSVARLWKSALKKKDGNVHAALCYLSDCEARQIQKDAPTIWGTSYLLTVAA